MTSALNRLHPSGALAVRLSGGYAGHAGTH